MAEYHTVYKGPDGDTTQWDDIQRKLGNLPAKVCPGLGLGGWDLLLGGPIMGLGSPGRTAALLLLLDACVHLEGAADCGIPACRTGLHALAADRWQALGSFAAAG